MAPASGCDTPHISCVTAMAKLMPPMLSAVSRTMGCTNKPSDMRMPMVIINTAAAASTISHNCR